MLVFLKVEIAHAPFHLNGLVVLKIWTKCNFRLHTPLSTWMPYFLWNFEQLAKFCWNKHLFSLKILPPIFFWKHLIAHSSSNVIASLTLQLWALFKFLFYIYRIFFVGNDFCIQALWWLFQRIENSYSTNFWLGVFCLKIAWKHSLTKDSWNAKLYTHF